MNRTKIEWCTRSLNPVVGCTYGCPYCYARRMNERFGWVKDFSNPQFFPERLKQLSEKKPQVIFMDSMSDIADWERPWLNETIRAIEANPQHRYLFLTKRPERCADSLRMRPKNVLLGISVTTQKDMMAKFNWFRNGADFLSIEPLLGPILPIPKNVKWVIIGAETGPKAVQHQPSRWWVQEIADACLTAGIPIFMKNSISAAWGIPLVRELPWEADHA